MKVEIKNIDELIVFIEQNELTENQIIDLCRYSLKKTFVILGEVDKFWFLKCLRNYKEKYHHRPPSEQPIILNGEYPFRIKDIFFV